MARIWVLLLTCVLLLMPGIVQAQAVDLRGAGGAEVAIVLETDCGACCQDSRNLACGGGESAGTFHATVFGASAASGPLGGQQDALRVEPSHQTGEMPWQLLVAAWALLGAALLLRGAHRPRAYWNGNDAS